MAAFGSPIALVKRSSGKFVGIDNTSPEASGSGNVIGLYQLKLTELHTGTLDTGVRQLSVYNSDEDEIVRFEEVGLRVLGDLIVEGERNVVKSTDVMVEDNYLVLNHSYTTASAQPGGLVVNYLPTSTTDSTSGAGVFSAGDSSTSPQVTTAASAFSAADIIQISGSASNDGLYEVLTHSGGVLKIKGTKSGVDTVEAFSQKQFVAETDTGASITKVNVSVLRAGSDGTWEVASGATTGLSYSALGGGSTGTNNLSFTVNSDAGSADEDASLVLQSSDGSNTDTGTIQYIYGASGSDAGTWKASADVWLAKSGGSTSDPDLEVDGYARFDSNVEFGAAVTITAGGLTITAGGIDLNGGGVDLNSGGMSNVGAVAGVTSLAMGGALSGVTTLAASGDVDLTEEGGNTNDPDLSVAGYAKFAGDVEVDGALQQDGAATFNGTVALAGASAIVSDGFVRLEDSIQLRLGNDDDGLVYYDQNQGKLYAKGAARSTAGQAGVSLELSASTGGNGDGSTAGGSGGGLYLLAANGGSGSSGSGIAGGGGLVQITAGSGGMAGSGTGSTPSSGGNMSISSGAGGGGSGACAGGAAGSLTIQGGSGGSGSSSGATSAGGAGAAITISAGNGGNSFGSNNGPAGGAVSIDAGAGGSALGEGGSAGSNGAITIGANNAASLALGRAAVTTTINGAVSLSLSGGSTGSPDLSVAGYAKFAQAAEFGAAVTITAGGINLSASGLSNAGAVSGVTSLAGSGAISGFTSLALSAAITGVTSITMNGALAGVTTLAASGLVDLDGGVRHHRSQDFYIDGFSTANSLAANEACRFTGEDELSPCSASSAHEGKLAGVWNGNGLVPTGKSVLVKKPLSEQWAVNERVYLSETAGVFTKTAPTTVGAYQIPAGLYYGAAIDANASATARILLQIGDGFQN